MSCYCIAVSGSISLVLFVIVHFFVFSALLLILLVSFFIHSRSPRFRDRSVRSVLFFSVLLLKYDYSIEIVPSKMRIVTLSFRFCKSSSCTLPDSETRILWVSALLFTKKYFLNLFTAPV